MGSRISKAVLLKLLVYLSPILLLITLFFNAVTIKIDLLGLGEIEESFNAIKLLQVASGEQAIDENIFQFTESSDGTSALSDMNYLWIFFGTLVALALIEIFLISIKSTSTTKLSFNIDLCFYLLSEAFIILYLLCSQIVCNAINDCLTEGTIQFGVASTSLYIPLVLHSSLLIGALICKFMYKDDQQPDFVQSALLDIQDWTSFSFAWMIFGYIVLGIVPIIRVLDMIAVALGLIGCVVYFLPLMFFRKKVLDSYQNYSDMIAYQSNSYRLSGEHAMKYQGLFDKTLQKKKIWSVIGMIVFIVILTIAIALVSVYKGTNEFLAHLIFNPSALILTGLMCSFPSLLYSQIFDTLRANDIRKQMNICQ